MIATEEFIKRAAAHGKAQADAAYAAIAKKREIRAHCALADFTVDPDNNQIGHMTIIGPNGEHVVSGDVEELHRVLFREQYRVGE